MDNKETMQNFSDMVEASEKLLKPWKVFVAVLVAALVLTNAIWGFVHYKQLQFAYMTPTEVEQEQKFDEHTQFQNYSSGVTDGK